MSQMATLRFSMEWPAVLITLEEPMNTKSFRALPWQCRCYGGSGGVVVGLRRGWSYEGVGTDHTGGAHEHKVV